MGKSTGIAWCDHTFNPWWGCFKISPGCKHCYAATFDKRVGGDNWTPDGPRRFFGDKHWNDPIRWDREAAAAGVRRRVFCASMADVFEDRRDLDEHRHRLWALIDKTPHLDWLLLTKRTDVMRRLWPWLTAPKNVWAGTTMEDQERADARGDDLLNVRAVVHFASVEPMIGPVSDYAGLKKYGDGKVLAAATSYRGKINGALLLWRNARDRAETLLAESGDRVEQAIHVGVRERASGFVEDDQLRVAVQRAVLEPVVRDDDVDLRLGVDQGPRRGQGAEEGLKQC